MVSLREYIACTFIFLLIYSMDNSNVLCLPALSRPSKRMRNSLSGADLSFRSMANRPIMEIWRKRKLFNYSQSSFWYGERDIPQQTFVYFYLGAPPRYQPSSQFCQVSTRQSQIWQAAEQSKWSQQMFVTESHYHPAQSYQNYQTTGHNTWVLSGRNSLCLVFETSD